MNNSRAHGELIDALLIKFGGYESFKIFKRNVGFSHSTNVTYGIPGESDLWGILAPDGQTTHIEIKTGSARLQPNQKVFQKNIQSLGGIYIVARSITCESVQWLEKIVKERERGFKYARKTQELRPPL